MKIVNASGTCKTLLQYVSCFNKRLVNNKLVPVIGTSKCKVHPNILNVDFLAQSKPKTRNIGFVM